MITILFFSVLCQTAYYEYVNAMPSLLPINLLLLQYLNQAQFSAIMVFSKGRFKI